MADKKRSTNVGITETDNYISIDDLQALHNNSGVSPINLDYYGSEKCLPGYAFGPNVRSCYVLHMVVDGKGELRKNNTVYPVEKGQAFLIFPGETSTNRPHQVWGNVNCVEVKGYVPCDETQEYPLIVCEGGRQDVYHEYIFEVKNGELCLVAEKDDAWPFDTDETDPEGSSVNDTYQWNGNEVSMDQYLTNREAALSGYQDINWKIW